MERILNNDSKNGYQLLAKYVWNDFYVTYDFHDKSTS